VAGLGDKTFDYVVPERWHAAVRPGTLVRISLHGRRVGAWVLEVGVSPPPGVALKPIAKVTGWGPPADVIDLARWTAWRWAGRLGAVLRSASPPGAVAALPAPALRASTPLPEPIDDVGERAMAAGRAVVRLPPAADAFSVVLAAARRGDALIVVPDIASARHLALRLRRAGVPAAHAPGEWARAAAGGCSVVGTRGAVWTPMPALGAVVVVDEHDEALQQEQAPTWHARDVAIERAARAGVPCALVSPCPTLEALGWGTLLTVSTSEERAGWPIVDVVDRRADTVARGGLLTARLTDLVRDRLRGRVLCVLNRTGRARMLVCATCGSVAGCDRCGAAVAQPDAGCLVCPRCGEARPVVCAACGATKLKNVRAGVSRVREELEALAGEPVEEITAAHRPDAPVARILIGTEALLHDGAWRGDVGVVAFLDFDQEVLAPRYRASEQAFTLLARAGRVLGGRASGGRLVVQTRVPKHPVVDAALFADPARLARAERAARQALGYPPFAALAEVSGAEAAAFVERAGAALGIEVLGPADNRWLLRAPDHGTLADALAQVPRPQGRLRVAVDPVRV
jgi:primosomal protein N' (replication factor Y)